MSILDKVLATVGAEPTPEARAECRRKARATSGGSGWLAQVLDKAIASTRKRTSRAIWPPGIPGQVLDRLRGSQLRRWVNVPAGFSS
jgi:hypothetical protein